MELRDRSPLVLALQHPFVGMISLALLMFFAGLGQGDVRVDGAVYAWVSKWMVVSGDWLNLYADRGVTPYFNKPPLQFWLMAITYKLFGINTWSAKLVTPIFALLCVVMTYAIARFRFSPALSATAGIILATTYTFFRHAVGVRLDPGVAFFVLAALWAALAIARRERGGLWLWLLMGAAWGLGMMLKSPIILLAAVITLGCYAWLRRWDLILNWRWAPAVFVCLAIWLPWHVHHYVTYGEAFTDVYFGREMASRWGEEQHGSRPIWFYLRSLVTEYWPWLPLALIGGWLLGRKAWRQPEATVRLLVVWIAVWFVVAHLAARKYDRYLVPWFPAVSIAAGYGLSRTRLWPYWRTWVLPNLAVIALLILVLVELFNVQTHRLDSPAVRAASPTIREQVQFAAAKDAGEMPTIYVSGIGEGSQCRLRFYTDAEVVPEGDDFDWSSIPPGNFIVLPVRSELHGRLPNVLPLAEDSDIAIYRVLSGAGGLLR